MIPPTCFIAMRPHTAVSPQSCCPLQRREQTPSDARKNYAHPKSLLHGPPSGSFEQPPSITSTTRSPRMGAERYATLRSGARSAGATGSAGRYDDGSLLTR